MAKKQKGPLPDAAEAILAEFFDELALAKGRKENRERLRALYEALEQLDDAGRDFAQRIEQTARVVLQIADKAAEEGDPGNRLCLAELEPTLSKIREHLSPDTPTWKNRRKKGTKWALDISLLDGLVAFGNRQEYHLNSDKEPRYSRLLGRRCKPGGPDWLTVFLLRNVVEVWKQSTGLSAPIKDENRDLKGDPDKGFHLHTLGPTIWGVARDGHQGQRSPIELMALVAALNRAAPKIGPTRIARRLLQLAAEKGTAHVALSKYLREHGGADSLESEIKHLRHEQKKRCPTSRR